MKPRSRLAIIAPLLAWVASLAYFLPRSDDAGSTVVDSGHREAAPEGTRLEGAGLGRRDDAALRIALLGDVGETRRVQVRVVSADGVGVAPVAGARVVFVPGRDEVDGYDLNGRHAGTRQRRSPRLGVELVPGVTDAEGRVEIDGPGLDEPGRVRVRADGFATELADLPEDLVLRVAMRPGLPIVGEVVEEGTGHRPEGMKVNVRFPAHAEAPVIAELVTDASGRFRSEAYHRGAELLFEAVTGDDRTARASAVVPESMPSEPTARLELEGRGRCVGLVLGADGVPRPGTAVCLVPRASVEPEAFALPRRWLLTARPGVRFSRDARSSTSRPDGSFVVSGLAFDVEYVAFAYPTHIFEKEHGEPPASSAPTLDIRPTRERPRVDMRLELRRRGRLGILVTDEEHAPLLSGTVSVLEAGETLALRGARVQVNGLEPGRYVIRVVSNLSATVEVPVDVPAGTDAEITVVVAAGARVDGVVLDREGRRAAHATVRLTKVPSDGTDSPADGRTVRTDDDGWFEVGSLDRVPWRIVASTATATLAAPVEVFPPARGLSLVVVGHGRAVLQLLAPGGTVPSDVEVRRVRGDEILRTSASVVGGRVEIDGFDGTPESVELIAAGFAPLRFEVTVPIGETRELGTMTLSVGEALAGIVVDARAQPVAGATVVAGHHGRTSTDLAGRFHFPGLPRGPLLLVVAAEGFLPVERTVPVGEPEAGALRVELARGARIRGVILSVGGAPADGVRVTLVPLDGEGDVNARTVALRTDEDGSFDVRVQAGRWRVEGGEADGVSVLGEVVAVDDESTQSTYVVRPR